VRIAVFDWDGTLCDSDFLDHVAAHETCIELGLEDLARDMRTAWFRTGSGNIAWRILRQLPRERQDRWLRTFTARFSVLDAAAPLFQGACEALDTLTRAEWTLAIVSLRSRVSLQESVRRLGIGDFFSAVVSADDAVPKPAAQSLRVIAERYECAPSEIVVIGNALEDEAMAAVTRSRFIPVQFCTRVRDRALFVSGGGVVTQWHALVGRLFSISE